MNLFDLDLIFIWSFVVQVYLLLNVLELAKQLIFEEILFVIVNLMRRIDGQLMVDSVIQRQISAPKLSATLYILIRYFQFAK